MPNTGKKRNTTRIDPETDTGKLTVLIRDNGLGKFISDWRSFAMLNTTTDY